MKMGFFRDRRRARAEAAREQQQRLEAESSAHGQDAMMSEEAALAAEARRMMLGDDGTENDLPDSSTSGDPTTTTTIALSADQEQKVLALHYHFDADRDGYLSYPELRNLQQTTSGAAMSVHEYTMICHALQCEPRKGISLDALRVTYASVQADDGEANLDLDYDTVFGRGGAGDDAHASSSSAGEAWARSNSYDHQLSSVTEESDVEDAAADDEQAEIPVEVDAPRLEMGDHVFRRRAVGLAQVHAIVVSMAPGDDGPLLLADFTGQNVVGEDDDDDDDDEEEEEEEEEKGDGETPETQNGETQNSDNDGQNEAKKKAATAEEQPPDPTVERVRIVCIEGKKNIRKWKKVRYGGSRFGSWFKRKGKENAKDSGKAPGTPKRSKSTVEEASDDNGKAPETPKRSKSTVGEASDVTLDESSSEYSPSKLTNQTAEDDEDALPPHKAKEAKNKKRDDDLPETDPGTLVVQRVNFLLENQNLIPPWHALKSNSECLAVWCKTGRWSTYQVSGYLNTIFMGQAKTAATVAAAASSATVTVPAAGYMGWLGFTTQVSLLALHPWLIPAIAGYGIASIGVPMYILKRCGKQWAKTTIDLNDEFWSRAPPEVYVDCIRKWAGLEDEEDD